MVFTKKLAISYLILLFLISRGFYFLLGIRYEGSQNINYFLQIIDPYLLKTEFIESIYYSSFPPFFNILIGTYIHLFENIYQALAVTYFVFGIILIISIFLLMVSLGVNTKYSFSVSSIFANLPPVILYENWFFYTYMSSMIIVIICFLFFKFLEDFKIVYGFSMTFCYVLLALTNAKFVFLIFIIIFVLSFQCKLVIFSKKKFIRLIISFSPIILIFLVCFKNYSLFGQFNVDTHFGFHMGNGLQLLSRGDSVIKNKFIEEYPQLLVLPMSPLNEFEGKISKTKKFDIPILDQKIKSTGFPNHHNYEYNKVSELYTELITKFILNEPLLYLRMVSKSLLNYIHPSNDYGFISKDNRRILGILDQWYLSIYPFILITYVISFVYIGFNNFFEIFVYKRLNNRNLTILIVLLTILYNTSAIFVTYGENNRYKFLIEPLIFIIIGLFFNRYFLKKS